MTIKENKGIVNTELVKESVRRGGGGVSEKRLPSGDVHVTAYSKDDNRRISWNVGKEGNISDVHSSKKNSHIDYKGGIDYTNKMNSTTLKVISIDKESADALDTFAVAMVYAFENIEANTKGIASIVDSLRDTSGIICDDVDSELAEIYLAIDSAKETIDILSKQLHHSSQVIRDYVEQNSRK